MADTLTTSRAAGRAALRRHITDVLGSTPHDHGCSGGRYGCSGAVHVRMPHEGRR